MRAQAYAVVTIHPYYDGNGRTAQTLATLLLYRQGYDLGRFYSLEEVYMGASHFWGIGRARKTDLSAYPRKCGTHPVYIADLPAYYAALPQV